ncbi:hypothetical protein HAALTHF_40750n [Vreelandella aquamarina]|nr:hypothetical protein HAALTHF_40750n [Halomonas axialensis]
MGQVHKAVTNEGETVVLKVQYPGLAEVLESDLKQVRRIMGLGRWFKVPQARLDALFEELAAGLRDELDYHAEALALARYRERYQDNPALVIPEPLFELSGQHVLAMRFVDGTPLRDLESADDATRQKWLLHWQTGLPRSYLPTVSCTLTPTQATLPATIRVV